LKAQVLEIEMNAKRGNYDGLNVTYKGMPFDGREKKPTTRFIFSNDPMYKFIQDEVNVGEWYDMEFKTAKNPKYTDLVSMSGVTTPQDTKPPVLPSNTTAKGQAELSPSKYHVVASMNWNEKQTVYADLEAERQASISRSVALDKATAVVSAMVAGGGYSAANIKKRDYLVEEVLATASRFFDYLSGVEEDGVDTSGLTEEPPFEQESM
jgi:hypothetical protein